MTRDTDAEEVKRKHRARIDGSREDGLDEVSDGTRPSVPSYADSSGVSDLGVDEPVVPKDVRGEPAADQPEPPHEKTRRLED